MSDPHERFWQDLKQRIDLEADISLEEAEARMDAAPNDALTEEEIHAIVDDVTAGDANVDRRPVVGAGAAHEHRGRPVLRTTWMTRTTRVAAAAAVVLALGFAAAKALRLNITSQDSGILDVDGKPVAVPGAFDPMDLPTTMEVLLDEDAPAKMREAALLRVSKVVMDGIVLLKRNLAAGGELGDEAGLRLDELGALIASGPSAGEGRGLDIEITPDDILTKHSTDAASASERASWQRTVTDDVGDMIVAMLRAKHGSTGKLQTLATAYIDQIVGPELAKR